MYYRFGFRLAGIFCFRQKESDVLQFIMLSKRSGYAFPLEMVSYAPSSKKIRKQVYLDKFIKNDRFIFFILALGDVRLYLTGDMEDAVMEGLPKEFFGEHVHILKIPHHGSETSTKILELGWDSCDIACSTVYRKGLSNLPVDEVMKQYKKNVRFLYCTGNIDRNHASETYGVVKVVTDVLHNQYSLSTEGMP